MPEYADVSPAEGLLVRLAGHVAIEGDGAEPRFLSSAQVQVAFARMVLERSGGTSREQLADTVWPDGLPETWASALRSVVSRVRSFVGRHERGDHPPVVARGGRYVLRLPPTAVVDLERAEQEVIGAVAAHSGGRPSEALRMAESAVTCLRRPLLPNHDSEWITDVRARLAELLVTGLEIASFAASALGDGPAALRFADEALRQAPLRESAHRARMTAHVVAGNRAEAVSTYHELRCALAEQLGIDPSPETQFAYVNLLGGPTKETSELHTAFRPGPRASVPFIGRRRELAAIMQAYSRTERGGSHLVLITGEPGIGRSRLMAEAARQINLAGGLVAGSRCGRGPVEPCAPLEQAVEALLAAGDDDLRARHGEWAERVLAVAEEPPAGPRRFERARAVVELLVRISADRPVLLFLDDLDLAGEDVFAALRLLFHRRQDTSLLVVATARKLGQCPEPLVELLRETDQNGWLYRISLLGLTAQDVDDLITEVVPAPFVPQVPAVSELLADTAGNAYLLLEMLWWPCEQAVVGAPDELSPGVHDYARARLAGLTASPRRILSAVVAAGRSVELDLAVAAAGFDQEQALDAVDQLLAEGILVAEDQHGTHRMTHEVVRRAIYSGFSVARRRDLHARLADAIESRRGGDLTGYATALAHHRTISADRGGDGRAVRSLWRAAARASAHGATADAVRLNRDALRHVPDGDAAMRAEAITNLGMAQRDAGHTESAQTLLDGALQAFHTGHLPVAARAALGLADVVRSRAELRDEAAALLDLLVHEVGGGPLDERVDGVTLARMVARQLELGSAVTAGKTTDAALVALTRELDSLAHDLDALDRRSVLAGELHALATAVDDLDAVVVGAHHQAMAAAFRGDAGARREAMAVLARRACALSDALLLDHAAANAVAEGRYTDAALTACLAEVVTGTRQGESVGGPVDGWTAVGPIPGSLAERQLVVSGLLQSRAWPRTSRSPLTGVEVAEHAMLALPEGLRGRPHLTVRAFATGAEPLPPGDEWLHTMGMLALGAVELGDPVTADAMRTMLAPHADKTCGVGYRTFVGPASFHLGRLAVVVGDWDAAEEHLTAALAALVEGNARPWVALAKQSLAWALAGRAGVGDRVSARALLAEANRALADVGLRHRVTASARR